MVSYQQKAMFIVQSATKSIKLGKNHICLVIYLFGFKDKNTYFQYNSRGNIYLYFSQLLMVWRAES